MGKKSDLRQFERGLVVGARQAGLSISQTSHLLGYSRTTISRVYREWREQRKTASRRNGCGRRCLVDDSGQRRMDQLIQEDRMATIAELTARYNEGLDNTEHISKHTMSRTLKRMGYSKTPLGTTSASYHAETETVGTDSERSDIRETEECSAMQVPVYRMSGVQNNISMANIETGSR